MGRLVIAEQVDSGLHVLGVRQMESGDVVVVGREADQRIAAAPPDLRVSRVAAHVTRVLGGWNLRATNRSGVIIYPWALPAWRAREYELLNDARIGLRIVGDPKRCHWVLLEDDQALDNRAEESTGTTFLTERGVPVPPLTAAQRGVLREMFPELLAWPPVPSAGQTPLIRQVARKLGITESGVQERLKAVRAKAVQLGLARQVALTDPEYVYVLVRAGYLRFHAFQQNQGIQPT